MDLNSLLLDDPTDLWSQLDRDKWPHATAIRDFMIGPGRLIPNPTDTLQQMSKMFLDAGLPLDRSVTIVRLLHAESAASVRMWDSDKGASDFASPYNADGSKMYNTSPSALAHKSRKWVRFDPRKLPDDVFGVVVDLKQDGITDYVCAPVFLVNGMENIFSFATKSPGGFSDQDIAFLRATFPAIAACQEILVVHRILKEVTRIYVGEEPHLRILAGDVHRGEVTRIKSAILFADMRGFTSLTSDMSAEDATALLNDYYDCLVPHIEEHGGEVLKFIGDGVLAIFRAESDGVSACEQAILAATASLETVETRNTKASNTFEIGISLHFGEIAFGNVGSGARLDYTVIGRDVNLASRIADLCGQLDQPLLLSSALKQLVIEKTYISCGLHTLKGLTEPEEVFTIEA